MREYVENRVLISGAAGFIGSHLCGLLLEKGYEVVAIDNFVTGSAKNIEPSFASPPPCQLYLSPCQSCFSGKLRQPFDRNYVGKFSRHL